MENRALLLSLAIFVSLLAIVQPTRPILAAELSGTPTAANLHRQLTRHCIEEVRNDSVAEPVIAIILVSSSGAEGADSKPAIPDFSRETALPAWPSQPIHRKLPPPSPKDG
jgi:hypothetical protein